MVNQNLLTLSHFWLNILGMENNQHQERLKQIETEILEIRREMSQFEFKAKKEEVERKKEIDKLRKESEVRRAQGEKSNEAIRNHLKSDRMRIVVVTKNGDAFRDAIVKNTPSPITYNSPKPKEIMDEE